MARRVKFTNPITLFSVLLLTSCSTTPPKVVNYSVVPGESVIIGNDAFWVRDCSPKQFQLNIENTPLHGESAIGIGSVAALTGLQITLIR